MSLERVSSNKCFGGWLSKYKFKSAALGGLEAHFNLFLPPAAESNKVPVLTYLAGLTCNEDTGAQKGGFLRDAASEGVAMLFPDTSPRGAGVEGEDSDWDFGTGAGFYLDATSPQYKTHYNMYSCIVFEIPQVTTKAGLPLDWTKKSVFGHSMGGHGALTIYLRSQETDSPFVSASAFAPITNPTRAPWGVKAFSGYLANGVEEGRQKYDATELVRRTSLPLKILVDSGKADQFYEQKQLLPENFIQASAEANHKGSDVVVRLHDGYDHSYYFISTYASEHVKYHARHLRAT